MNETTTQTPVKVGDIFNMSWGFDQTNNNFFQVTRLSVKGIFIREINSAGAGGDGMMCRNVVAAPNSFKDSSQWCGRGYGDKNPETFRRVSWYSGKPSFSIRGRYYASLWDGKLTYESWYA
jgi:hypothetical protein